MWVRDVTGRQRTPHYGDLSKEKEAAMRKSEIKAPSLIHC